MGFSYADLVSMRLADAEIDREDDALTLFDPEEKVVEQILDDSVRFQRSDHREWHRLIVKRRYRIAHAEEIRAYQRAWYAANIVRVREYDRARYPRRKARRKFYSAFYYQQNKSRLLEKNARYYAENREKIRARQKAYREENREKIRQQKAEYYQRNREKILAAQKARNAVRKTTLSHSPS